MWVLDLWPESVSATTNIKSPWIYGGLNKLVSYIYGNADHILVSSRFFRQSVIEKLGGRPIKIGYLPNWAEDNFVNGNHTAYPLPDLPTEYWQEQAEGRESALRELGLSRRPPRTP